MTVPAPERRLVSVSPSCLSVAYALVHVDEALLSSRSTTRSVAPATTALCLLSPAPAVEAGDQLTIVQAGRPRSDSRQNLQPRRTGEHQVDAPYPNQLAVLLQVLPEPRTPTGRRMMKTAYRCRCAPVGEALQIHAATPKPVADQRDTDDAWTIPPCEQRRCEALPALSAPRTPGESDIIRDFPGWSAVRLRLLRWSFVPPRARVSRESTRSPGTPTFPPETAGGP